MKEKLKSQYVNGLCHGAEERIKGKYLEVILAAFQLDLAKCRNALAESEAEVRFSLVDPLVRLLSDFDCQCKVCMMLKRPEWLGKFPSGNCCTLATINTCSDVLVANCYLHQ